MARHSNIIARLTSVKGIATLALVLTALVLPACGVGEEEGFDEGDTGTEEEVFEEEGVDEEEGIYEEEEGMEEEEEFEDD